MAYLTANVLYHTLTADKEIPPGSKREADKKTNWGEMAKAKEARIAHREEWMKSLSGFANFGAFFGATDITGEPPPEPEKPDKRKTAKDAEARVVSMLEKLAERAG